MNKTLDSRKIEPGTVEAKHEYEGRTVTLIFREYKGGLPRKQVSVTLKHCQLTELNRFLIESALKRYRHFESEKNTAAKTWTELGGKPCTA